MKTYPLFISLLLLATGVAADVQIKIKDARGLVSTISSNGKAVRIDEGSMPGYVLIDYASGQFMMVDESRRQIMHSSLGGGGGAGAPDGVPARLVDSGKGPSIAGYPTRKLAFSAGGKSCGTIYASRELLKDRGVMAMFESMRTMQQKSRGMMGGVSGMLNDCQRANLELADALEANGAPMRIVDANGNLQSEVVAVDSSVSLGRQFYQAPAGMARVDLDQQIGEAMQQGRKMMENMPDMNQMMQQMQQGGGQMTEEMQQQMQKMMQQLQQLQQQNQ